MEAAVADRKKEMKQMEKMLQEKMTNEFDLQARINGLNSQLAAEQVLTRDAVVSKTRTVCLCIHA